MRISDWMSDVCSSDLCGDGGAANSDLGDRARRRIGVVVIHAVARQIGLGDVATRCVEPVLADRVDLERTFGIIRHHGDGRESGRASCRERVWKYVKVSVVA